jgi:16S rRNA processing protein RimM
MIQVDDCYYLGYVKKTNGIKGAVEVSLDVDDPGKYKKKESVLLMIKNNLTPFFIEQFTIRTKTILVKFKGVDTANESEQLVGTSIYMPLSELPPLKGKKKFYYHEVIGYTAIDIQHEHGNLGVIQDIVELTAQAVIQIKSGNKEILVPMIDDFIVEVKKDSKEFILSTPEGLVDMYLGEG